MKTRNLVYLFLLFFLVTTGATAQFKAGEDVRIKKDIDENLYVAGDEVDIEAKIDGDLVAGGGTLSVSDSVNGDIIAAGGELYIRSAIQDDLRAVGGDIDLNTVVGDDATIAGGDIKLSGDSYIFGNLLVAGGRVIIDTEVDGAARIAGGDVDLTGIFNDGLTVYAGEVEIDAIVRGESTIVAEEIDLESGAEFYGDVEYYSDDGEMDFGPYMKQGRATYNPDLRKDHDWGMDWRHFGFGIFLYWIFFILSALLLLTLLNVLFGKKLQSSVDYIRKDFAKSLAFGLLYIFGTPFAIALTFAIVIGIPVGVFALFIYIFSFLFAPAIVSLLVVHWYNKKNDQNWSPVAIILISLVVLLVLRLLFWIPILGWLLFLIAAAVAFGAILLKIFEKKKAIEQGN